MSGPPDFVAIVDGLLPRPSWSAASGGGERSWTVRRGTGSRLTAWVDGHELGAGDDWWCLARLVRGDIEIWVSAHAVGYAVVHACVVAVGGRALVVPGRSMAGKTTLALALTASGAEYCSDEYAVLDPHGHVHPYPRRPAVRVAGPSGHTTIRHLELDELGAPAARAPRPVALIAGLRYSAGCAALDVLPLAPALAALCLLDNAVGAQTESQKVLEAVAATARSAPAIGGLRGEAAMSAPVLLGLLEAT